MENKKGEIKGDLVFKWNKKVKKICELNNILDGEYNMKIGREKDGREREE